MSFYSDFSHYYDVVFPFEETTYSFLLSRIPSDTSRVLDVGCGTGDYCGRLASQRYETVGIDLDPWMIERATRKYPSSEFHVMGLEEVGKLHGTFGAAYCIGNVAAHVPWHRMQPFMWTLRERLSSEAIWIVQTVNWDFVLEQDSYGFPDVRVEGKDVVFERSYPEISEERVLFRTRLTENGETVFEGETPLYPVRSQDCIGGYEQSGFEFVAQRGGFDGTPFDPQVMSSNILVFRRL